jgi:Holliday junction resolvase RusA-like endonuclease
LFHRKRHFHSRLKHGGETDDSAVYDSRHPGGPATAAASGGDGQRQADGDELHAKFAAAEAYQGEPLDVPVSVLVRFVFPRPASVPKKAGTERMPHLGKPDVDNLFKSLADALNGQLWVDDSRVYQASLNKFKAAVGEQPHTEVVVKWGE